MRFGFLLSQATNFTSSVLCVAFGAYSGKLTRASCLHNDLSPMSTHVLSYISKAPIKLINDLELVYFSSSWNLYTILLDHVP